MSVRNWVALTTMAAGAVAIAGSSPADARPCGCRMAAAAASGGGAAASPATGRSYDPATVTTLKGTATAVQVVNGGGRSGGLHVTLESGGKSVDIHVGPTWFLDRQDFHVAKGDVLEVTGSMIGSGETKALIAREIRSGDKRLKLRDEQGVPVWAGGPRRP